MADKVEVPDELKQIGADRFRLFEELGADGVENEHMGNPGPLGLSSGDVYYQKMGSQYVRWKREQEKAASQAVKVGASATYKSPEWAEPIVGSAEISVSAEGDGSSMLKKLTSRFRRRK
jgi:hypothetical protein